MVYARQIEGVTLTFGVSGRLIMNALVMYDHQTDSLWSQFVGEAVDGALDGIELELIPSRLTTMGEWTREHPETIVLDRGFPGGAIDPYRGYYLEARTGVVPESNRDDRLVEKSLVVGITTDTAQKAYPFGALLSVGALNDTFQDRDLVLFMNTSEGGITLNDPGGSYDGNGGSVEVFDRTVGGRTLSFKEFDDLHAYDLETRSTWDKRTGVAVRGEFEGQQLIRIPAFAAFWFGWSDYYPDTEVYESGS